MNIVRTSFTLLPINVPMNINYRCYKANEYGMHIVTLLPINVPININHRCYKVNEYRTNIIHPITYKCTHTYKLYIYKLPNFTLLISSVPKCSQPCFLYSRKFILSLLWFLPAGKKVNEHRTNIFQHVYLYKYK